MRYALVGNNDGPLRLLKALIKAGLPLPVFVGLQKKPDVPLFKKYTEILDKTPFQTTFEEAALIHHLEGKEIESIVNCFCNFKFTKLLELYRCYNIHPSYLPRYRGRHPLHWALINGEKHHGITLHEMSPKYDDGAIIWQEKVALNENMSVADLRELLMQKLEMHFPAVFAKIMANSAEKQPNFIENSTYIKRRSPEDSELTEWHDGALLYRKIKALRSETNPAFISLKTNKKLPIIDVKWEKKDIISEKKVSPEILKIEKNALLIKTADNHKIWLITEENQPNSIQINFRA
ncbi:formyltransferase family protein [Flavimarina sp. Hel_I_48]|uniref:formyltransferase family protein n=1 Tax=Flavimarina sp. Hel_I_48 TaxID=1392488 RepID=UPI0004DF6843|nr:formyltransferase family protein [Flavimarina sp. Hel_I_48]